MTTNQSETPPRRKRRWTAIEKQRIVLETYEPGSGVSFVARRYRISPSLLYQWRQLLEEGALAGVNSKDGATDKREVKQLKARIRELEAALGRKTMDNEILKEAIKIGREKKLISRQPLDGLDDFQ